MKNYTYVVDSHPDGGYNIVLTQISTGKTIEFRSAGGIKEMLVNHMDSLTDACCDGYFKKGKG